MTARKSARPAQPFKSLWLKILPILILLAVLQGCIFSPHKGGGVVIPPAVYLKPLSPESVLYNLGEAYTHRDTTAYKACYAVDFKGTFLDQNDPIPQLSTYFKNDEAMHIAYIAKNTQISVNLVLTNNPLRTIDLNDPPGWITVNKPFESLQVGDWFINPGGEDTIDMKFAPIPPASAQEDTTWVIKELIETRRSITGT